MFESKFYLVRSIYYFNIVFVIFFAMLYGINAEYILYSVLVFFFMNPLGIAVSYHRYWSHKSFEWKNRFWKNLCTVPAMISGVGSILGWVGMHRLHHIESDKPNDPHLAEKGFWNMLFMRSYTYNPNPRLFVDLLRDDYVKITHKYWLLFPLGWMALCFLFFGIEGVFYGFCFPAMLSLITQNCTNYFNHKQTDTFEPTNVGWINFFNFGDGWHYNHHQNPQSYTTKVNDNEIDPAGYLIKNVFAKKVYA